MKRITPDGRTSEIPPKKIKRSISRDDISSADCDIAFIDDYYVNFRSNTPPFKNHKRGPFVFAPFLFQRYATGDVRHYGECLHVRIASVNHNRLYLIDAADLGRIKKLVLCSFDPIKRAEKDPIAEYILRMPLLEELSITFFSFKGMLAKKETLEEIFASLRTNKIALKKLKIFDLPFNDEEVNLISSYLQTTTSLTNLSFGMLPTRLMERLEIPEKNWDSSGESFGSITAVHKSSGPLLGKLFGPSMGKISLKTLRIHNFDLTKSDGEDSRSWWAFLMGNTSMVNLKIDGPIDVKSMLKVIECTKKQPNLTNIRTKMAWLQFGMVPSEIIEKYTEKLKDHPHALWLMPKINRHGIYESFRFENDFDPNNHPRPWVKNMMDLHLKNVIRSIETSRNNSIDVSRMLLSRTQQYEIAKTLSSNTSITQLKLHFLNFNDTSSIVTILKNNTTTKHLSLKYNKIDTKNFCELVPTLIDNNTLSSLDLGANSICICSKATIEMLCRLLTRNTALNYLELVPAYHGCEHCKNLERESWDDGLFRVTRAIKKNSSLWHCNFDLCGSKFFFSFFCSVVLTNSKEEYSLIPVFIMRKSLKMQGLPKIIPLPYRVIR